MKNAMIFHGAGNNSEGNWFPWLKKELEKKGYSVWSPDLPHADVPITRDWLDTVFNMSPFKIDNDTILIGHSAGATLILRILEKLPKQIQIHKAFLVAGPCNIGTIEAFFPYKKDLTKDPFQWDKIKQSCKKFYFYCSDNDPYECGIDQSAMFQKHLGGEILLRVGEAHFNLEKGPQYKKFPELLEKILE